MADVTPPAGPAGIWPAGSAGESWPETATSTARRCDEPSGAAVTAWLDSPRGHRGLALAHETAGVAY